MSETGQVLSQEAAGHELSPWAQSAVLTDSDYGLIRAMAAKNGQWLVGGYGAERYRFQELIKAGLVKPLSSLSQFAPGYELTVRGRALTGLLDH